MGRLALLNREVIKRLIHVFGQSIISAVDGSIDRKELSKLAFSSSAGQRKLTSITFPEIYRLSQEHFALALNQGKTVVFDAAMIFEWEIEPDFDVIVVVNAAEDQIIKRAASKLNTTSDDIRRRISVQIPAQEKKFRADRVIENDGNIKDLEVKAEKMWKELKPIK